MKLQKILPLLLIMIIPILSYSQVRVVNRVENPNDYFSIIKKGATATIFYEASENVLIKRSAEFLASDIQKVTGTLPNVVSSGGLPEGNIIIVATIGNSPLVERLVNDKKLDVEPIRGQWERFIIQTIDSPFPGVKQALVIVGSDRRGAAYGVFSLSEAMGVSPWYWWADVPVKQSGEVYLAKGRYVSDGPAIKYRGIFINDEAPALRNWAKEKFGGFNHKFYENVFELILRNKANYLWPAMWLPSAFADDDPENPRLADEFGIVISTSHHEPMMRAHHEWVRFNGGEWNYKTNKEQLQEFWREGIERMGNYESVVTLGMRGDGDKAMIEETYIDLLQAIIADQRKIIAEVTGKPAHKTPQVWAIYKEVQDYWDRGMRVDEDIIILFSNDNWGNLRILPKKEDLNRKAGFGMYFHFNYVGAPVSYRWLNVSQIEQVWEQMNLAYTYGVRDLWLVNVGDIKPMELPISFFLDFAWDPEAIQAKDLPGYYVKWAKQQFGEENAREIAELLSLYTKYNARRTHEMLKPYTYSIVNYREADRIIGGYEQLLKRSTILYEQLPESHRSAFYQLVHSPIEMSNNLNQMYVAAGKNKLFAEQGRASANRYAERVKELFFKDAELTRQFHKELENGKWNHMMSQTRIGYTSWNHPRANIMPAVSYIHIDSMPKLGFEVEHGQSPAWAGHSPEGDILFSPGFSEFDPINRQSYYVDIFNMGGGILSYYVEAKNDWIELSKRGGSIRHDDRVYVSIDWGKAPKGKINGNIVVKGAGKEYIVSVPILNNLPPVSGFVENNGVVAIEAANYTRKIETNDIRWTVVPNLGRTHSSIIVEPGNAPRQKPGMGPLVEYDFTLFEAGEITVETYLSPTQDFLKQGGLKFAIAINNGEPQIINMNEGETKPDYDYAEWWMKSVADHIKIKKSKHRVDKPGKHTLKVWMIDPGIVFQRFVIDAGGLRPSYLGPPESVYLKP